MINSCNKMLSLKPSFHLKYLASQFVNSRNALLVFNNNRRLSVLSEKNVTEFDGFDDNIDEEALAAREAEIEKSRNKSKLRDDQYNKQNGKPPTTEILSDYEKSLRYKRKLYGKYGESSKVDPSILWPTKEELYLMKEYETVSQPFTVQELMARSKEKKELEENERKRQEALILQKVSNVKKEILEFHKRVHTKKMEALALKEEKDKLVAEIKGQFGYNIDVRDERFKAALAERELKEKKALKDAKKAMRQEKVKLRMEHLKKSMAEKETKEGSEENKEE